MMSVTWRSAVLWQRTIRPRSLRIDRHLTGWLSPPHQVSTAVKAMTEHAVQTKTLVDEVNVGSQEQSRGMDQIAKAVVQMQEVTQRAAANARDGATAGTELNDHAVQMRRLVHEMRDMVGAAEQA
jgi:methyl-accepting chemotaxis protein/methyl-accepting chemotaxis protein-1 (serine sensor receptor)